MGTQDILDAIDRRAALIGVKEHEGDVEDFLAELEEGIRYRFHEIAAGTYNPDPKQ